MNEYSDKENTASGDDVFPAGKVDTNDDGLIKMTHEEVESTEKNSESATEANETVEETIKPLEPDYISAQHRQERPFEEVAAKEPMENNRSQAVIETAPPSPSTTSLNREYVRIEESRRKNKKSRVFSKFVAVALIAALFGAAGGAGMMWFLGPRGGGTLQRQVQTVHQDDKTGNYQISDIAEMVMPTVVGITNYGEASNFFDEKKTVKQATGSGVIIESNGTIVTNFHVIAGASKLKVTLADGKSFDASVVGYDQAADLAVIKIKGNNFPAIEIGDSGKLRVGDLAVAVGNPLGENFSQTVTDGIISGINRKIEMGNNTFNLLQINCAINSGNSGGALVNGKGQLIGINSVKIQAEGVEGLGFAIPINNVMSIVKEIKEHGTIEQPYIGISGYTLTPEKAKQLQIEQTKGLLVMQIVKGSPADEAGIHVGDIIRKMDGQDIASYDDLAKALKNKKVGQTITLTVDRDNQAVDIGVILGKRESLNLPKNN